METLLAEQPLILSLILGVVAAGLVYGWLQTGRWQVGAAGLVAAALIPLAWVIAEAWVTQREQITALMFDTADAIQANQHQRALDLIADPVVRQQAALELQRWHFDEARITKIRDIALIEGSFPPEADVDMFVRVSVRQQSGGMNAADVPRRLRLRLRRDGDRWRITDYQHLPPVGPPDPYSTRSLGQ